MDDLIIHDNLFPSLFPPSPRLPIIRTGDDTDTQISSWRELLSRVVDQSHDTSQDLRDDVDVQSRRIANRRPANARRAERAQPSTYRGWAPGTTELDHPARNMLQRPLPSPHFELHPNPLSRSTATRRYLRELERNQPARETIVNAASNAVGGNATEAIQQRRLRDTAATRSPSNSLRTNALLEAARRQHRLESLRERIRNFTDTRAQEHEQYLEQIEILDEYTRLTNDYGTSIQEIPTANEHLQAALDEHRSTKLLQEGIKYMDDIRGRFTGTPIAPPPSSWLRPGACFSGEQQANNLRARQSLRRQQVERLLEGIESDPTHDSYTSLAASAASDQSGDWWPVKVKITSIDYKTMALTGTMEAFNVSKTKGTVTGQDSTVANITTYLEGEIVDFHKHALRTTNFKAGSMIDSTYWRKLEPFKSLSNTEIVDGLRDAEWIREHIARDWILMRWKGIA